MSVPARPMAGVLCLLAVLQLNDRSTRAAELVSVGLASGRRFTAYIDARTNDDKLWLRFEGQGILVLRPIDWDRLRSAEIGGRTLTVADFKQHAASLSSSASEEVSPSQVVTASIPPPSSLAHRGAWPSSAASLRSVDFHARIANWDDNVNMD